MNLFVGSEENNTSINFTGTKTNCPLVIQNTLKLIFNHYVLKNQLSNALSVEFLFDQEQLTIVCSNPPRVEHIDTGVDQTDAKFLFNDLCQQFVDWCDEQNVPLQIVKQDDYILNDKFYLILNSPAFNQLNKGDKNNNE